MINTSNLDQIKPGHRVKIVEIAGGAGKYSRLLDMGITPGTEVTVMAVHPFKGPVVVKAEGTPIAIGRHIAHDITVRPVN